MNKLEVYKKIKKLCEDLNVNLPKEEKKKMEENIKKLEAGEISGKTCKSWNNKNENNKK